MLKDALFVCVCVAFLLRQLVSHTDSTVIRAMRDDVQ